MNFYEFLEAIARVAEKISILPFRNKNSNSRTKLNLESRRLEPLHLKLEGLLLYIYYKLGKSIKKSLQEINSEDLIDFDNCVLGKNRVSYILKINI